MLKKIQRLIRKDETAKLFVVVALVNLGNYILNLFLGRLLGPDLFAEAGIIATSVLIFSFIALGVQMTSAKFIALAAAASDNSDVAVLRQWLFGATLAIGLVLSILLGLFSTLIQEFLHFKSQLPIIILIVGLPVYLLLSVKRGVLQGMQQFKPFMNTYILEMVGRLIVTIGLVWYCSYSDKMWFSESIAVGFFASFVAGLLPGNIRGKIRISFRLPISVREIVVFFLIIIGYELTQILISFGDVVLVKHFTSDTEAGIYAATSLVGRMVYFATWAVVMVLFPKVVSLEKKGLPHNGIFARSFLSVLSTGIVITILCGLLARPMVTLLFGDAFLSMVPLLWKYSLATTLFACANVFAYYYMSLNKYYPIIITAMAGIIQTVLIVFHHSSLLRIIEIQLISMSSLLLIMICFHLFSKIKYQSNENRAHFPIPAQ